MGNREFDSPSATDDVSTAHHGAHSKHSAVHEAMNDPRYMRRTESGATQAYVDDHLPKMTWGGDEFELERNGVAKHTVNKGDTMWKIASDVLYEQHKDDPNYKPDPKEVWAMIHKLYELNPEIDPNSDKHGDPNKIRVGQEIRVPSDEREKIEAAKGEKLLVTDKDGNVVTVQYPDGKTLQLERDEKGNIKAYTDREGNHWTKKEGSDPPEWTTKDGRTWTGTVDVDKDGTETWKEKGSEVVSVMTADGQRYDEVRYPDKTTFRVNARDGQGNITSYTDQAGTTYVKEEGSNPPKWKSDDPKGGEPATWTGDVVLQPDGTVKWKGEKDQVWQVQAPDGTRSTETAEAAPPPAPATEAAPPPTQSAAANAHGAAVVGSRELYATDGVYNPISPPGVDQKGVEPIESEHYSKDPKGGESNWNYDIESRKVEKVDNPDGTITYTYTGQLDQNLVHDGDNSNFRSEIKSDAKGNIIESDTHYNELGHVYMADGPNHYVVLRCVHQIKTTYDAQTNTYVTVVYASGEPGGTDKPYTFRSDASGNPIRREETKPAA